eukprot:TRINITY_DN11795_c0_g1_i1.p1 TRINITY_DN11795_c0_g1~~TRINITY_DN11795_c0_g1_i1.p1  ORF type:complete len:196 (+),score=12.13 TRINITY_DN11795_c0_g1_i1:220-807(+)
MCLGLTPSSFTSQNMTLSGFPATRAPGAPRPPAANSCQVCRIRTETRCSRCRAAFYCGQEHQREGWETHRYDCRILASRQPRAASAEQVASVRLGVSLAAERLIKAIREDCLPDHETCKVFGIPPGPPELERAVYAAYQAAVKTFGVMRDQIVDAHMTNMMDELVLSIPEVRESTYGSLVIANGGIRLERFPGVP